MNHLHLAKELSKVMACRTHSLLFRNTTLLNTHINEELNKTSQIYAYAYASILVEVYNELNKECG